MMIVLKMVSVATGAGGDTPRRKVTLAKKAKTETPDVGLPTAALTILIDIGRTALEASMRRRRLVLLSATTAVLQRKISAHLEGNTELPKSRLTMIDAKQSTVAASESASVRGSTRESVRKGNVKLSDANLKRDEASAIDRAAVTQFSKSLLRWLTEAPPTVTMSTIEAIVISLDATVILHQRRQMHLEAIVQAHLIAQLRPNEPSRLHQPQFGATLQMRRFVLPKVRMAIRDPTQERMRPVDDADDAARPRAL